MFGMRGQLDDEAGLKGDAGVLGHVVDEDGEPAGLGHGQIVGLEGLAGHLRLEIGGRPDEDGGDAARRPGCW